MNRQTVKNQIQTSSENWAVIGNNRVLISSDLVKAYFLYNFGSFYCSDLYNKFNYHNLMCASDLARAFDAWNATYNPLNNYDGTEININLKSHGLTTRTTEETRTDNLSQETTTKPDEIKNSVTTENTDGTKTTNYATTYDNENLKKTGETVPVGGTKTTYNLQTDTTTENTGTQTKENEETESRLNTSITHNGKTYTANDVEINELTKGGNLGVTTSQQMIESEIDMRLKTIYERYLNQFAVKYMYFVGGENYDCTNDD